jgi:hypothetical protein
VNLPEENGAFFAGACDSGDDCVSGCCVELDGGGNACVPDYVCGGDLPDLPAAEIRRGLLAGPEAGPADSWVTPATAGALELATAH